jgi:hypothetical protein
MTIEKAINRIAFRFKNIKTYPQDQEAINVLVEYVNNQNKQSYMDNLLFAKLFTHFIMLYASSGVMDARKIIFKIESILQKPMIQILEEYRKKVPFFKFQTKVYNMLDKNLSIWDMEGYQKEAKRIAEAHDKELIDSLKKEYTLDEAIEFIETQVNRLSNKYNSEKYA